MRSYQYGGVSYANPNDLTQLSNGYSTTTYAYDNNGNLVQKTTDGTTTTYVYDYANRLTALGSGGATTTYGYDWTGNRVIQTGTSTTWIYPFKWYSVASSTGTGAKYSTTTDYVFNGDTLVSTIDKQFASGIATGTAQTHYIHPDHLGSTNVVTNASGTVEQTLDFFPYGATRISTGQNTENRQFIGQFTDQSALSYLNARYYDSSRGQFLSEDPTFLAIGDPALVKRLTGQDQRTFLSDPQQLNSMSYSRDNPVTRKDPSGLMSPWEPIFLGGEVIDQIQWQYNLGKYYSMSSEQRQEDAPKMSFEFAIALPGMVMIGSTIGTQLMLAQFALQGLDYGCSKMGCPPMNLAANGMTPLQIQQSALHCKSANCYIRSRI